MPLQGSSHIFSDEEAVMYADHGCRGEIRLGTMPPEIAERLASVPGVWLEYEATKCRIVVRHAQPSSGPALPLITGELVQLLSVIPTQLHAGVEGGDLFVHTHDTQQFVRIHVEEGGVLRLQWARPDFGRGERTAYRGRCETIIDPCVQKLDGEVEFRAEDPRRAAASVMKLAGTFEGLYPEGQCEAVAKDDRVKVSMQALNLDSHALIEMLDEVATEKSLAGAFTVSTFGEALPDGELRIVFEDGTAFAQHPVLWPER
jgi:hypothetical protein